MPDMLLPPIDAHGNAAETGTRDATSPSAKALDVLRNIVAKGTVFVASAAAGVLVVAVVAIRQWNDPPIVIEPFTIAQGSHTAGLSPLALADQTKASISTIYSHSNDLFERRKLGERTLPLDVTIGTTGLKFQALAAAFNVPLTAAEVTGSISDGPDGLTLQWTTSIPKVGAITVDSLPVGNVKRGLECLALKTVARISPDVAANYLHTRDESDDQSSDDRMACLEQDDVELYSRVSQDPAAPPATRVNALVGLSLHYSNERQFYDELTMAQAATEFASRTMPCDGDRSELSVWQGVKCTLLMKRRAINARAHVAARMQLGAALSDYASSAPTLSEMRARRSDAINAYARVIAIKNDYSLAYDAMGLQRAALGDMDGARQAYERSLAIAETSPAHIDLALLSMHGRNDSFDERAFNDSDLDNAERHLRGATKLDPVYWDAHSALGYVLYERGRFREAAEVLVPALEHDESNRDLRNLLTSTYTKLCEFDAARAYFTKTYQRNYATSERTHNQDDMLNTASDWGRTLDKFGFRAAALEQETAVLDANPNHVDARRSRGEMEIASGDVQTVEQGLTDLRQALDASATKTDGMLAAYLTALLQTDRWNDAITAYETWSKNKWVPALATNPASNAEILPPVNHARLGYAKALLKDRQWERALNELEVLVKLGVTPGAEELRELRNQATGGGASGEALARIGNLPKDGALPAALSGPQEDCSVADVSKAAPLAQLAMQLN
jgi:tetratricopeptide (TPR) repeat protein